MSRSSNPREVLNKAQLKKELQRWSDLHDEKQRIERIKKIDREWYDICNKKEIWFENFIDTCIEQARIEDKENEILQRWHRFEKQSKSDHVLSILILIRQIMTTGITPDPDKKIKYCPGMIIMPLYISKKKGRADIAILFRQALACIIEIKTFNGISSDNRPRGIPVFEIDTEDIIEQQYSQDPQYFNYNFKRR